jgi:hypothetical protein
MYSATTTFTGGCTGGSQIHSEALKMQVKRQKTRKSAAIPTRVLRGSVPVGNTRAIERARLTRLNQKIGKYNAMFNEPESSTLNVVAEPAKQWSTGRAQTSWQGLTMCPERQYEHYRKGHVGKRADGGDIIVPPEPPIPPSYKDSKRCGTDCRGM